MWYFLFYAERQSSATTTRRKDGAVKANKIIEKGRAVVVGCGVLLGLLSSRKIMPCIGIFGWWLSGLPYLAGWILVWAIWWIATRKN
jgi:hypothetical protein